MDTLDAEFSTIMPKDADLMKLNSDFLIKNGNSARHVQASLRARQVLDPKSAEENQKDLMRILALNDVSLEDAICGLDQLKEWKAQQRFQDDYVAAAQQRWSESSAFGKM